LLERLERSLFGINLVLIWIFGVSALAWFLFYTDLFPEIGGVLALGGLFSWFAFVAKLLTEQRIKDLQGWLDRRMFNKWATILLLALIVGEVYLTGHRGALRIESLQESADRVVRVYHAADLVDGPRQLPTRGQLHIPLLTSAGSPARLRIKVNGYPDKQITLGPRDIARLYVPESFFRPVVLLRPTADLVESVKHNPVKLWITVGGHTAIINKFAGQAVWVGCDDDVEIPQALQDSWRVELTARLKSGMVQNWLTPEAAIFPGEPYLALIPKQTIAVKQEDVPEPLKVITVKPVQVRSSFPQVEDLDVPKS